MPLRYYSSDLNQDTLLSLKVTMVKTVLRWRQAMVSTSTTSTVGIQMATLHSASVPLS